MRHHRTRFRTPRTRKPRLETMRRLGQESWFMHSDMGRMAKREAIGEQRRKQDGLCGRCGQAMAFEESKFESSVFVDGQENKVVHRKCPTGGMV